MALILDGSTGITFPNEGTNTKAWVNFNGTGTVAVREDGNVSSITDNGTGLYTVNFTTAMPNANYATMVTGCSYSETTQSYIGYEGQSGQSQSSKTASSVRISNSNTAALYDPISANVAILR